MSYMTYTYAECPYCGMRYYEHYLRTHIIWFHGYAIDEEPS